MAKLTESSFFPLVFPSVFHSAWLVPWQGGMGWDDGRGLVVSSWWLGDGLPLFFPLLFLLLSPCSAYLFLDLSTPFVYSSLSFLMYIVSCFSLVFLSLFLHSFTPCPERWSTIQRDGMKRKTKRKCWPLCCGLDYNMLQYFSIFSIFNFLSLSLLTFVFCVLYLPGWKNCSLQFQFWYSSCTSLCTTSYHYLPRTQWWTNPFLSSAVPLYIIMSSSLFWHYNCVKPGTTNNILPEVQI